MKIFKYSCSFIFISIFFVFIIGCSGSNNFNGSWEVARIQPVDYFAHYLEITGKNFTAMNGFLGTVTKGTYSISGNSIELKLSNGSINVYPFSRTENTITIGGIQYNRK